MIGQRAFTLIETVIFILVLAVGLTGIVSLSTTASRDSALPMIRERALIIAHAYMDEIISKRWDENTPVGGGCVDTDGDLATPGDSCTAYCSALSDVQCSRSKCNLVGPADCQAADIVSGNLNLGPEEGAGNRAIWDDIDDYNGYVSTPPETITAAAIPGYGDYTATVLVTQPAAAWHGIPAADVRRIAVTVAGPQGEALVLVSYRVNF